MWELGQVCAGIFDGWSQRHPHTSLGLGRFVSRPVSLRRMRLEKLSFINLTCISFLLVTHLHGSAITKYTKGCVVTGDDCGFLCKWLQTILFLVTC